MNRKTTKAYHERHVNNLLNWCNVIYYKIYIFFIVQKITYIIIIRIHYIISSSAAAIIFLFNFLLKTNSNRQNILFCFFIYYLFLSFITAIFFFSLSTFKCLTKIIYYIFAHMKLFKQKYYSCRFWFKIIIHHTYNM